MNYYIGVGRGNSGDLYVIDKDVLEGNRAYLDKNLEWNKGDWFKDKKEIIRALRKGRVKCLSDGKNQN